MKLRQITAAAGLAWALAKSPLINSSVDVDSKIERAVAEATRVTPEKKLVVMIDWTQGASSHRFFIIRVKDKKVVYSWYTSHGKRSGGLEAAQSFSNKPGSNKSSLGLMLTAEPYFSRKFNSTALRLDGIERGINDNVRKRGIVMHAARYVSTSYMENHEFPGRSEGCITLNPNISDYLIDFVKKGTLVVNFF